MESLSINAQKVLEERYLMKDNSREVIETPLQLFKRVAGTVSCAEANYRDKAHKREDIEEKFLEMMVNLEFMPNSPTLMNACTPMGQLSALSLKGPAGKGNLSQRTRNIPEDAPERCAHNQPLALRRLRYG